MTFTYRLGALFLVIFAISTARADDFDDGVRILDTGDSLGAAEHFKRCSNAGDIRCQTAYANFLQRGEGIGQNLDAAFELYLKAAFNGDATAQLNIGEFYEKGLAVPVDLKEAAVWYCLAAKQGRNWARGRKEEIVDRLSSADLTFIENRIAIISKGQKG